MRCPTLAELPPIQSDKTGWPWTVETSQLSPVRLDGSPWPRVSIITPSYSQGRFIEETIRSVLLQGYPNIEYIVVDGGSTDQSVGIITKYERWLASCVSEQDRGQSEAIRKGLDRATGSILSWLNSDDVLLPGAIASVVRAIPDANNRLLVAGQSEYRDETGTRRIWTIEHVPKTFREIFSYFDGIYFAQPSVYFTRSGLYESGGLNEDLHYAMDLDLWLRMAKTSQISLIERHLSWMRQHDDAKTWRDTFQVIDEVERVLTAHSGKVPRGTLVRARRLARRRRSQAWVAVGLRSRRTGNWKEASQAAYSAVRTRPGTAFSRPWASLVLWITLLAFARRLVFGRRQ